MVKPVTISDEEVLAGLNGDEAQRRQALQHFFSNPALLQWALQYVRKHGGDEQSGRDVFEEAFIVFERQLRTGHFRSESSLKTWFHSIVRWQWLVMQRKSRPWEDSGKLELPSSQPNPEQLLIQEERRVILQQLLVLIGERCQRLLGYFQLSYTMSEIRGLEGFSSDQVAANEVHGCRTKLKQLIAQHPDRLEALKNRK